MPVRTKPSRATSDPLTYIERFLVIRHMDTDGLIPFILNAEQRKIMSIKVRAMAEGKLPRFIILKHRRSGVPTLEQALMITDSIPPRSR